MPDQSAHHTGNNSVHTREFFTALMDMERRIMDRFDELAKKSDLDKLEEEVGKLRERDKIFSSISGGLALIFSVIIDRLLGPR